MRDLAVSVRAVDHRDDVGVVVVHAAAGVGGLGQVTLLRAQLRVVRLHVKTRPWWLVCEIVAVVVVIDVEAVAGVVVVIAGQTVVGDEYADGDWVVVFDDCVWGRWGLGDAVGEVVVAVVVVVVVALVGSGCVLDVDDGCPHSKALSSLGQPSCEGGRS